MGGATGQASTHQRAQTVNAPTAARVAITVTPTASQAHRRAGGGARRRSSQSPSPPSPGGPPVAYDFRPPPTRALHAPSVPLREHARTAGYPNAASPTQPLAPRTPATASQISATLARGGRRGAQRGVRMVHNCRHARARDKTRGCCFTVAFVAASQGRKKIEKEQ